MSNLQVLAAIVLVIVVPMLAREWWKGNLS